MDLGCFVESTHRFFRQLPPIVNRLGVAVMFLSHLPPLLLLIYVPRLRNIPIYLHMILQLCEDSDEIL